MLTLQVFRGFLHKIFISTRKILIHVELFYCLSPMSDSIQQIDLVNNNSLLRTCSMAKTFFQKLKRFIYVSD